MAGNGGKVRDPKRVQAALNDVLERLSTVQQQVQKVRAIDPAQLQRSSVADIEHHLETALRAIAW